MGEAPCQVTFVWMRICRDWAQGDLRAQAVAKTVGALADACKEIAALVAAGPLSGELARLQADKVGGDFQTELDILANTHLIDALRSAPVAAVASEELDVPVELDPHAPLIVALDPLDGSSNIDTNVSIGTIFSLLPTPPGGGAEPAAFLRRGHDQVAAGYVLYGPQTSLVLTLGAGTDIFTLDPASGAFVLTKPQVQVPPVSNEFAINASNARHWAGEVRGMVRRLHRRRRGPARAQFQHALDRLDGGGGAPHPDARRRLCLSGRRARRLPQRAAAPGL